MKPAAEEGDGRSQREGQTAGPGQAVRLRLGELDRGLHVRVVPPVLQRSGATLGFQHAVARSATCPKPLTLTCF